MRKTAKERNRMETLTSEATAMKKMPPYLIEEDVKIELLRKNYAEAHFPIEELFIVIRFFRSVARCYYFLTNPDAPADALASEVKLMEKCYTKLKQVLKPNLLAYVFPAEAYGDLIEIFYEALGEWGLSELDAELDHEG